MGDIRKRKNKDGSVGYCARVRKHGAKSVSATFSRKTDAKRWILETENAVIEGRYFDRSEDRKHTLKEAIDRFVAEYPCDGIRKHHLNLWDEEIGHLLLSAINSVVIADTLSIWKRKPNKRNEKRGGAVLNRYLSSLSVVLGAAKQDWGWMQRNPALDVRRFKESRGRVRYLSDQEREMLLKACRTSYSPFIYLVVVLALSTGMRKSEIRYLRWSDVDLERGVILLLKTKNKESRRVAVCGHALELLREHSKVKRIDTDLLFPGRATYVNGEPIEITKAWHDARKRAGLKDFVFHDLRHSAASYLAMNGATSLEIAEVLGHKSLDMAKRYSHLSDSHVAGVVEKMNQRIFR